MYIGMYCIFIYILCICLYMGGKYVYKRYYGIDSLWSKKIIRITLNCLQLVLALYIFIKFHTYISSYIWKDAVENRRRHIFFLFHGFNIVREVEAGCLLYITMPLRIRGLLYRYRIPGLYIHCVCDDRIYTLVSFFCLKKK